MSEQKDDEGSDQIGVRPIRVDFIVHNINTDVLAIRRVRKGTPLYRLQQALIP